MKEQKLKQQAFVKKGLIIAITRYVKGEGGYLVMSNNSTVDVSRSRKELLMQKLQPHKE